MTRELYLPTESYAPDTVRRYGFSHAMGLFLSDALGGLWRVTAFGSGFELTAPYRFCTICNYGSYIGHFEEPFPAASFCFHVVVRDVAPDGAPDGTAGGDGVLFA